MCFEWLKLLETVVATLADYKSDSKGQAGVDKFHTEQS